MKRWLRENRRFLALLLCFGFFRTAIADWNPVPTGSMRPTIVEGDVVLVDRLAYDVKVPLTDIALAQLDDPVRGDIVTFSSPTNGTRLIKRLVGLPGDVIEVRHNVLLVNGEAARYEAPERVQEPGRLGWKIDGVRATERVGTSQRRVQFLDRPAARRDFGPMRVPSGHYFMMGDSRDNSEDSRYIGPVPRKLLIGRASHVLVSADILTNWMPRFDRIGHPLQLPDDGQ